MVHSTSKDHIKMNCHIGNGTLSALNLKGTIATMALAQFAVYALWFRDLLILFFFRLSDFCDRSLDSSDCPRCVQFVYTFPEFSVAFNNLPGVNWFHGRRH